MKLEGTPAMMMGMAWLGAALALHSRFFWGRVKPIWRWADLGLLVGLAMLFGGWGYAFVWAINHTFQ